MGKLDVLFSFSATLLALFHMSLLFRTHSPRQEAFEKIGAVEQQAACEADSFYRYLMIVRYGGMKHQKRDNPR
jgi:hypothetical protein